jgi:hypothetical protein
MPTLTAARSHITGRQSSLSRQRSVLKTEPHVLSGGSATHPEANQIAVPTAASAATQRARDFDAIGAEQYAPDLGHSAERPQTHCRLGADPHRLPAGALHVLATENAQKNDVPDAVPTR